MEKDLNDILLKDLCARLPYGVKIKTSYDKIDEPIELRFINPRSKYFAIGGSFTVISGLDFDTYECKPYLFPLSSMTEEQKEELEKLGWYFDNFEINNINECFGTYREYVSHLDCFALIDWLDKNHFDYIGMIPLGLAIDATGLNIY